MMKNEFLARLKDLLSDLPQEEREEAVRYYEDYFADAGPLEESRVLRELVSPEDVAEKIRAGFGGGKPEEDGAVAGDVFGSPVEKSAGVQEDTGVKSSEKASEGASVSENMEVPKSSPIQGNAGADGKSWGQNGKGMDDQSWGQNREGMDGQSWGQSGAGMPDAHWEQNDAGMPDAHWGQNNAEMPDEHWTQEDARMQEQRMRMGETYAQDYGEDDEYTNRRRRSRAGGSGSEAYPRGATVRTKSYFSPVIFILALVIGIPIFCPIILVFICMMGGFF
ncbi:MAG: DUF1700 domain-containing protein, partial [Lachnospiraceae bacterium]|nr:DUF1700 domain-containing protein [Lachnospiraceae bacterium]